MIPDNKLFLLSRSVPSMVFLYLRSLSAVGSRIFLQFRGNLENEFVDYFKFVKGFFSIMLFSLKVLRGHMQSVISVRFIESRGQLISLSKDKVRCEFLI